MHIVETPAYRKAFIRYLRKGVPINVRSVQRQISAKEVHEAIETAKKNGTVSEKIGKYGTRQLHYKGKNGVTVIMETEGRNAG